MFERYTEKARRVIFFARYEASQFGSPYIETEHLLLGLLREDKALTNRFLRSHASVESIRKQIEGHTTIRTSTSEPSTCCWDCCAKKNASQPRFCTSVDCGFQPSAKNWRAPARKKRSRSADSASLLY